MSLLQIKDLSFAYEKENFILNELSFQAEPGESIGIIGANGAGKSTFMKLLVGLYLNFSGEISVAGQILTKRTLGDIRKKVGFVFQDSDSQLFMPTVYEDIAFGPRNYGHPEDKVKECVEKAMEMTNCTHLKERQIYKMSDGEKKRVSIAAILALEPEIILMDEPSAALDPRNRRKLITLLNTFPCLRLIASHDLDMIWETCSRTVLIHDGRIIADGQTKDILLRQELLEKNGLELPLCAKLHAIQQSNQ
ncbi:MAG: ABC transporter ATP-binding protein [Blautia sp.]|nr:ABC transporter ATP-binding protein [Blautia sp.]